MRCAPCLLLALLLVPLAAAEPKQPAAGGITVLGAADAEAAFARQAGQVPDPSGTAPAIQGVYVWGGRADEAYRPFFQWEFRVKAGAALGGLRLRTVTLNPDRTPAFTGEWKAVGGLAAGARTDVSIKQNCSAFTSYQVDAEWTGGSARWVAADKISLPVSLDEVAAGPYLLATAYNHDPDTKGKVAVITWWLWNLGGVAANETVQTVVFLDPNGKTVASREVKTGTVAPGSAKEHKLTLPKSPAGYSSINVSARCADSAAGVAADGGFTTAEEIEVAKVRAEGKQLKARVRNGLPKALAGLVVSLTLTDKDGKAIRTVAMGAVDLKAGAEADIAGNLGGAKGWLGYEMTWSVAATPAPSAAKPATEDDEASGPVLAVQGLEFRQKAVIQDGGKLYLKGELSNRTGRTLTALVVTFTATGQGKTTELVYRHEALEAGDSTTVVIEAPGLASIERLDLGWKAK